MKKTLSVILAILMMFSMATFAFAEEATALTKDQALAKAIAHVKYDSEISLGTYAITGTYNDDFQGEVEVYNVTSTLILTSGRTVVYKTVIDKYSGKIYYQSANVLSLLTYNLTVDQAYSLALEALGVNQDNTVSFTKEAVVTADGKDAYHFVFCEGYSQQYECTVMKTDGTIEDIKISQYNDDSTNSISGILERIVLFIKVLISKLSISNLLEKISAADLLKVFQFFSN